MAPKLSPQAQAKLAMLDELDQKVQKIYGLVEQFAAARDGQDVLSHSLKRGFGRLKLAFLGQGMDQLAQLAAGMETASGRAGSPQSKVRILREAVGSMKFQLDLDRRVTLKSAEDKDPDQRTKNPASS